MVMRINLKSNILVVVLGIVLVSVFFDGVLDAQVFSNKTIELENNSSKQSWNLIDKLVEKEDVLKALHLEASSKSLDFYEKRISQNGTKISVTKKKLSEQNKDIGLKIMNKDTGEGRVIKIAIRVQKL